jgi:hypothetical protein
VALPQHAIVPSAEFREDTLPSSRGDPTWSTAAAIDGLIFFLSMVKPVPVSGIMAAGV